MRFFEHLFAAYTLQALWEWADGRLLAEDWRLRFFEQRAELPFAHLRGLF